MVSYVYSHTQHTSVRQRWHILERLKWYVYSHTTRTPYVPHTLPTCAHHPSYILDLQPNVSISTCLLNLEKDGLSGKATANRPISRSHEKSMHSIPAARLVARNFAVTRFICRYEHTIYVYPHTLPAHREIGLKISRIGQFHVHSFE